MNVIYRYDNKSKRKRPWSVVQAFMFLKKLNWFIYCNESNDYTQTLWWMYPLGLSAWQLEYEVIVDNRWIINHFIHFPASHFWRFDAFVATNWKSFMFSGRLITVKSLSVCSHFFLSSELDTRPHAQNTTPTTRADNLCFLCSRWAFTLISLRISLKIIP